MDQPPDMSIKSLKELVKAEAACTRCPLYKAATQVVPGEGPSHANLMLVGEQPGDKEDLAGKPFVGPSGQLLDRALADAGIDREETYITGAVKHFKFERRGKRRLHKRPNNYEIERCKIWLDHERELVKPSTIVALGVTAARSLTGKTVTISKIRKSPLRLADGTRLVITMHPSALLRIQDEADKHAAYRDFVAESSAEDDRRAIMRTRGGRTPAINPPLRAPPWLHRDVGWRGPGRPGSEHWRSAACD
jgi:uracil-DNA glycosylase